MGESNGVGLRPARTHNPRGGRPCAPTACRGTPQNVVRGEEISIVRIGWTRRRRLPLDPRANRPQRVRRLQRRSSSAASNCSRSESIMFTCNRGLRQRLEHLFCDSPFECMLACVRPHRVRLVLSHSHHAPHPPYSTVGHAVGTMGVIVPSGRALLRKPPRPSWCELWWSYPMPTTS